MKTFANFLYVPVVVEMHGELCFLGKSISKGSAPGRLCLVICCVLIFSEHYIVLALSFETQNPLFSNN